MSLIDEFYRHDHDLEETYRICGQILYDSEFSIYGKVMAATVRQNAIDEGDKLRREFVQKLYF